MEVERRGEEARVVVDSVDVVGRYVNEADTHLTLIRPGLDREDIELEQTAPGRYEARFNTGKSGAYHLELSQQQNGTQTFRQTRGVVVGYPDELRLGPPDEELMKRIADVSGGRYAPPAKQIFDYPQEPYTKALMAAAFELDAAVG